MVFAFRQVGDIRLLTRSAERMASGAYDATITLPRNDELGRLATTFDQLRERLRTTTISRDYLDKVLGSMSEALLLASSGGPDHAREPRGHPAAGAHRNRAGGPAGGRPRRTVQARGVQPGRLRRPRPGDDAAHAQRPGDSGLLHHLGDPGQRSRLPWLHRRRPQHRRAQDGRAADPLPCPHRRADQGAEPHAVPAPAAAVDRAGGPPGPAACAALSRRRPLQGHQRHLRPQRR